MEDKKLYIGVFALVVLMIGGFIFWNSKPTGPGKYDTFTQCLKDKGVKFYGAFWCPHCQNQKKMFGNSSKLLPYVECSLPSGNGQTQECIDKNIQTYPTWEFADGSRETGELSFERLAEKSSCSLP
jgi:hypothetical protein